MKKLLALAAFGPTAGVAVWSVATLGPVLALKDALCVLETGLNLSAGPLVIVSAALIAERLNERAKQRRAAAWDAGIAPVL